MTGYHPDFEFLESLGVRLEGEDLLPVCNPETLESNVPGIYLAGVIVAGSRTNEIFIENGRLPRQADRRGAGGQVRAGRFLRAGIARRYGCGGYRVPAQFRCWLWGGKTKSGSRRYGWPAGVCAMQCSRAGVA